MIRTKKISRPVLDLALMKQFNIFLEDLLILNIDDVAHIISDAYVEWLLQLSLEDVERFAKTYLPPAERPDADYQRYARSGIRRFFMSAYFADLLMWSDLNHSQPRSGLVGWQESDPNEKVGLAKSISSWLKSLECHNAFDVALEITLRWADRYNTQMGLDYARLCGRNNVDEYTDENLTMFLRWCIYTEFEYADMGNNMNLWKD